jgi:hypothetical protein
MRIQALELKGRFVASSDHVADLKGYWILMILFERTGEKCIAAAKLVVVPPAVVL